MKKNSFKYEGVEFTEGETVKLIRVYESGRGGSMSEHIKVGKLKCKTAWFIKNKRYRQMYEADMQLSDKYQKAEREYNQLLKEIDGEILKIYQISNQEKALIDYTHEISIPLIKRRNKQRIFGSLNPKNEVHKEYLAEYAKIFTDHYNNIYNSDNHYFEIEIWHSEYMIGVYFKVIPEPSKAENQIVWKQDVKSKELLKMFSAISFSNQSQELFIQKDIKGFEENGFYVVKPNEFKNWHYAVAYLDLSEFIDAIMKAAKQEAFV